MSWLQRLRIDKFLLVLISVVILASLFPCRGVFKILFEYLTTAAIALLFFMHGAKLSRDAIMGGMSHWRLHLVVFLSTFALFPVLGICLKVFQPSLLSTPVYLGFLYLCALPATVQSKSNPVFLASYTAVTKAFFVSERGFPSALANPQQIHGVLMPLSTVPSLKVNGFESTLPT